MSPTGLMQSPISFSYGSPQQSQPSSGGFGGFLESLLPTIGSLGGMALGSVLAPGIGTAAGGAGGGMLGQFLEDKLTGQNSGLGTYALQGGLGALGGLGKAAEAIGGAANAARAGEGLGAIGNTLRFGARGAQEVAPGAGLAQNVIDATNANAGRGLGVNAASKAASSVGQRAMVSGAGSLSKRTAEQLIPNLGDMRSLGYSDISSMASHAPAVSGPEGALTTLRDQMVQSPKASTIDTSNFQQMVDRNMNVSLTNAEKKNIMDRVTQIADKHGLSGGAAPGMTPAVQVQAALKEIGGLKASSDAAKQTVNGIYGELRNAVNDATANIPITDSMKGQAISALRSQGVSNPNLMRAIRGANSWGDLASIESKFVTASKAAQEGAVNAARGGIPGLAQAGKPTLTGMANEALGSLAQKGVSKGAGTIEKLIGAGTKKEVTSLPGVAAQAVSSGVKAQTLPRLLTGGIEQQQQAAPSPDQANQMLSGLGSTGGAPSAPSSAAGGLSAENFQKAMLADLALNGGKNVSSLMSMYNAFAGPKSGSLPTDLQTRHDNINGALSALDAAESNLTLGGGAQGPMGVTAKIPGIGQFINSAGTAYDKTRVDTATQLAKAVTGNSRAPASIVQMFLQSLPDVTDTPQQASQKLQMIRNELYKQAGQFGFNDITQGAQ